MPSLARYRFALPVLALLVGCGAQDAAPPPTTNGGTPAPVAAGAEPIRHEQAGPGWSFRAEWPAALKRYPALLAAVEADNAAARQEIEGYAQPADPDADAGLIEGQDPASAPVEAQLRWSIAVETASLVSVVLDGYAYTGGAHGLPLHAVHHLDPSSGQRLDPALLFSDEAGWQRLAERVRAQLYARVEAELEGVPEAFVDDARRGSREWIDEGTTPGPAQLGLFVPQTDLDGRIEALAFIFPPYQVGPYAEGTQAVSVGLDELGPWLSAPWAAALGLGSR